MLFKQNKAPNQSTLQLKKTTSLYKKEIANMNMVKLNQFGFFSASYEYS